MIKNPDLPKLLRAMASSEDARRNRADIILNAAADELEVHRGLRSGGNNEISASNPHLSLAKMFKLDYGDVLLLSDFMLGKECNGINEALGRIYHTCDMMNLTRLLTMIQEIHERYEMPRDERNFSAIVKSHPSYEELTTYDLMTIRARMPHG